MKKVTIKISKNINYFYDVDNRILTPLSKMSSKQKEIFDAENIKDFTINLQLIISSIDLDKEIFVKKILSYLQPSMIVDKMIQLLKENPNRSFKKILSDIEFNLIKEISNKIIGSDDDPTRIYEFLSEILTLASSEIKNQSSEFKKKLTQELFNQGLEF